MVKRAYLYSRVSKATQAEHGQGLDRQSEAALKFLEQYPEYTLADDYNIIDAGVSAYTGANVKDSAGLGGFIKAVREGHIPHGSLLVIEAPDRLTRLGIRKGQRLFDELANNGIDIGLVRFGLIIRHDDENDFTSSLIVSVGLYLGHLESKQKSERVKAAFAKFHTEARNSKKPIKTQTPLWINFNKDKTTLLLNKHVNDIKRMIELRFNGHGVTEIARTLTGEGFTHPKGKPWNKGTVRNVLMARQLIGEFQPLTSTKVDGKRVNTNAGEPIQDYYPRVLDDQTFYAIQRTFKTQTGGRTGGFQNILRGVARCATCNASTIMSKSRSHHYLRCTQKHMDNDKCSQKSINMTTYLPPVLTALKCINFPELLTGTDTSAEKERLKAKEAELLQTLADNAEALVILKGSARDAVMGVLQNTEDALAELRHELLTLTSQTSNADLIKSYESFSLQQLTTPEERQAFNQNLKRFVASIWFHDDYWTIQLKGFVSTISLDYKAPNASELIQRFYQERKLLDVTDVTQLEAQGIDELTINELLNLSGTAANK